MPGPKWHHGGGGVNEGRTSNGLMISGGIHGGGPRYTPSELSYFNQVKMNRDILDPKSEHSGKIGPRCTHSELPRVLGYCI